MIQTLDPMGGTVNEVSFCTRTLCEYYIQAK